MQRVFHLIPHTHWDREWYLSRAAFLPRLVAMVDELIGLLERHPALRFTLDGQTVLLEDYLAVRPSARPRIRALVSRRQLAVGPWYVLADEIVPAARSLERNLQLGHDDARALGEPMRVLYSPDAFGHPAHLPALAARFGIRWGVVWRGVPSHARDPAAPRAPTRLRDADGVDLYRWRGSAGRSLLVHHLPPDGYEAGAALPAAGGELAVAWRDLAARLAARSLTRHVAVPIGADHHVPHPELPRLIQRLARIDPTHRFRWSRWEDYFAAVERGRPAVPVIDGDLRATIGRPWSLQGVHGSRCRLKRLYGAVERLLVEQLEPLFARAASPVRGVQALAPLWRPLVQAQFHDTLCGTVADDVAAEQEVRLASVRSAALEVRRAEVLRRVGYDADRAVRETATGDPTAARPALALWNRLDRPWRGVITAEVSVFRRDVLVGPPDARIARSRHGPQPFHLRRPDGRRIGVQVLTVERGLDRADCRYRYPDLDLVDRVLVAFDPGTIRGHDMLVLERAPGSRAPRTTGRVAIRARGIDNGLLRVTAARNGTVSIFDRRAGRRYTGLLRLVDEPDRGDLYTPWVDPRRRRVARVVSVKRLAAGPLLAGLAIRWRARAAAGGSLSGRTEVTLRAGSPIVRCRIVLENRARNHRFSVEIPRDPGARVRAGSPDGAAVPYARPPTAPVAGEAPLASAPAHDFLLVGGRRRGLLVRHPGFFEYEPQAGAVRITLVRSVGQLSRGDLPTRPGHAAWPMATPAAQEPGRHVIELAVGPLSAAPGDPAKLGDPDPVTAIGLR